MVYPAMVTPSMNVARTPLQRQQKHNRDHEPEGNARWSAHLSCRRGLSLPGYSRMPVARVILSLRRAKVVTLWNIPLLFAAKVAKLYL